ncbi:MAG: hypothetical protein E6J73_10195 [Deltaproteobacteria bacterium]|nr:MAG: hypothetical protein E6J73_10195 [Deltaproteobacteria bacterium]
MIGRDHAAGAGRILRDNTGVAGNMFTHMRGEQSRPDVVAVAGLIADDDRDRLTLEKRRLRRSARRNQEPPQQTENHFVHFASFLSIVSRVIVSRFI